ncbi:MAG: transpeptidase family protein [Spirochaetaceae bacterium]|jgi:cell division protein FtsI (penicillin-binding protein 3)|nr:transpeptidase family protein [Spirochaetaceae bacterium]
MQINRFYSRPRLLILLFVVAVFTVYVVSVYARLAFKEIPPPFQNSPAVERGSIVDRNGKPLAVQVYLYHLAAEPANVPSESIPRAAALLSPVTGIPADALEDQIRSSQNNFVYLKRKMSEPEYEAAYGVIKNNNLQGFYFDRIPGRLYPENSLASQLVGFAGDDGAGLTGVERSREEDLKARPSTDPASALHGHNVYLTIDTNLQYKLEQIARQAMERTQAESLMMLVADSRSGEILSYISLPSANLNEYPSSTIAEQADRPANFAYEPGSVFKIFSVATFIDNGVIDGDDTFYCGGEYFLRDGGGRITCLGSHGAVTARDALRLSCNVALAQMSERIDSEPFLKGIRSLGFGSRTGVELPGETAGSVKSTSDRLWSRRSKATMSFGQEISVSALQVVEAATALANQGIPVKLTLISRITNREGEELYKHEPQFLRRVFSPETARYVLSCMESTAESGTGSRAALGDIALGVKTGTAQMAKETGGGYSETDFLSNCVAIFPVRDPRVILYLVITKAQGETLAGRIAAPVVAEAANVIIDHLGMFRSGAASFSHSGEITPPAGGEIAIGSAMPDLTGVSKRAITRLLEERRDLQILLTGDGWVVRQSPAPGAPVRAGMKIELHLE